MEDESVYLVGILGTGFANIRGNAGGGGWGMGRKAVHVGYGECFHKDTGHSNVLCI